VFTTSKLYRQYYLLYPMVDRVDFVLVTMFFLPIDTANKCANMHTQR
jgi:hypothetical protein